MARVYISIGSNVDRERHIRAGVQALQRAYGALQLSTVYESVAVGFAGNHFYNLVAGFDSDSSVGDIAVLLKGIENANGRDRSSARFAPRTLDLDILTWGDASGVCDGVELPRDEILLNAFVLLPLSEIAPQACHPVTGQSYAALWQAYPKEQQSLWPIAFVF